MTDAPPDLLPILIGVTGKRRFADESASNSELLRKFSDRFRALLAHLDTVYRDTPKALLCGGAAGTDLAAARVALERPSWSVVLMLPFARDIFELDFKDPPFDSDLPYFRELCSNHPRVMVKTLRTLHLDKFDDSKLEPLDARRNGPDDLIKAPGEDNQARSWHFEQLGLWLARNATLLVAAAPCEAESEKPLRPGGVARTIAYRRTSTPDKDAQKVIERSSELLSSSPFDEPDGGHVLWIDPSQDPPAAGQDRLPGVEVLRPIQRARDLRDGTVDFLDEVKAIYRAPMHDPFEKAATQDEKDTPLRRKRGALALASAFQRAHARRLGWRQLCLCRQPAAAPGFDARHPAEFLEQVRDKDAITKRPSAISTQQEKAADLTRLELRLSAALFVLAIASYEAFTEVEHRPLWLSLYVGLLLAIAGLAWLARAFRLQLIAEDFRGLKEMTRVQLAWWSVGVDRMVDRVHLRTVDSNLRIAREAAATISLWALLRCTALKGCDVSPLKREKPSLHYAQKWIDEQANYFAANARPQFGAKELAETAFFVTFAASMAALFAMLAMDGLAPDAGEWAKDAAPLALALLPLAAAATVSGALWFVSGCWRGVGKVRALSMAPWAAAVAVLGAALTEAEAAHRLLGAGLGTLGARLPAVDDWAAPGGLLLALVALGWSRAPNNVKQLRVQRPGWPKLTLGVALVVTTVALTAFGLAPALTKCDPWEAVSRLVLAQAVLLLAGSGMVRWYTERRNHLAQAAKYDDMLRIFRRAQSWLRTPEARAMDRETQQKLVELGELALDENEAWLKAHRDRPTEPIAGS